MAMRIHVLAVRTADAATAARRLGFPVDALGPWQWALASVWSAGQLEAGWRVALASRESAALGLRATTVDDAFLDLDVFVKGDLAARLVHHYGGLLAGAPAEGGVDSDGTSWDAPLDAAQRQRLADDETFDPEMLVAAAGGATLREAARATAAQRAESLAAVAQGAGATPDRACLESLLLGEVKTAVPVDDPLEGWADVPDLLEALGLEGFRGALREKADAPVAGSPDGAAAGGSRDAVTKGASRVSRGRAVGCLVIMGLLVGGAVVGGRSGGALGAVGGLALGALVVVALIGLRLWRGIRAVKEIASSAPQGPVPPPDVRARSAPLLTLWRLAAARMGEPPPGGLFGQLYPGVIPAGDPASRGLVAACASASRRAEADRRLRALWAALLDAEMGGRGRGDMKRQFRDLKAWLSSTVS